MSKSTELKELLKPVIEEAGYKCVDVTFEKMGGDWILTAFIDNDSDEGISLEDCEVVSRVLSPFLDEKDPIEQSYLLEVSSPGIDRPFTSEEDYENAVGTEIEVKLYKKVDKKKEFVGILKEFNGDSILLETDKGDVEIELKNISKANPYIEVGTL